MLTDLTIKDFLAEMAGSAPVPSGGNISALDSTITATLTEVMTRLAIGRKKYAEVEEQMKTIITEAATIREHLTEYIDKDSKVYDHIFSAFKLPKETLDKQVIRMNAIQSATKGATIIPMRVAEEVGFVTGTTTYVAYKGNQNAVTDARMAMMAVRTCVSGASLSVRINLTSIQDEVFVERMRKKADELEANAVRIEQRLLDWVKIKL